MMESFVIETDHVVEPLNARLYNTQDLDYRYRKIFLKIREKMKFTLLMTTLPAAILANGLLCDTDGKCDTYGPYAMGYSVI